MNDAAVVDVLKRYGKHFDLCVFLQPTSPLRFVRDIDKAIEKFYLTKCDSLLSVMKNKHFKFLWSKEKIKLLFSNKLRCKKDLQARRLRLNTKKMDQFI